VIAVNIQETALTGLLDTALELALSSRPQDGSTAAYILCFLIRIPSFTDVLRIRLMLETASDAAVAVAAAAAADAADDDDDDDDDSYYICTCLLLQLLRRQLDVATVNLLQASEASVV